MPCSTWEEVAGKKCASCGKYATHYYGGVLLCCECHGGFLVDQKTAKYEHERILLKRDDKFHEELDEKLNDFDFF